MAFTLVLEFNSSINVSTQVGDVAYFTPTLPSGGFDVGSVNSTIELGEITAINSIPTLSGQSSTIEILCNLVDSNNQPLTGSLPSDNDFIMFAKNKVVNTTSLVGYYADIKFKNDSNKKIELFSIGSDIFESSK